MMNLYIKAFGIISVKLSSKVNHFEYEILSANNCINMQLFFSKHSLVDKVIIGERYLRLSMRDNANDLDKYFQIANLPKQHDLSSQLNTFYQRFALKKNSHVYLNIFCPFWLTDKSPEIFIIRFKYTPIFEGLSNNYTQSLQAFGKLTKMNDTSLLSLFENFFTQTAELPKATVTQEIEYNKDTVLKVTGSSGACQLTQGRIQNAPLGLACGYQNPNRNKRCLPEFARKSPRQNLSGARRKQGRGSVRHRSQSRADQQPLHD